MHADGKEQKTDSTLDSIRLIAVTVEIEDCKPQVLLLVLCFMFLNPSASAHPSYFRSSQGWWPLVLSTGTVVPGKRSSSLHPKTQRTSFTAPKCGGKGWLEMWQCCHVQTW